MFHVQKVEVLVEDGNRSVHISVPEKVLKVPVDFTQDFFRKVKSLESVCSLKNPYSEEDLSEHFDTLRIFLTETVLTPILNKIVRTGQDMIDSRVTRVDMDTLHEFLYYPDEVQNVKDRVQEVKSDCEWWEENGQEQWEGFRDLMERVITEIGKGLSHPGTRKSSLLLRVFQEPDSYESRTEWYETIRQSLPSSVFETGKTPLVSQE